VPSISELAAGVAINGLEQVPVVQLGDTVRVPASSWLRSAANLADLPDPASARATLGLGSAALRDVGTAAGQVAAGNDSRITGALQAASNLADLASASDARTALGLGTLAVQAAALVAITGGAINGTAIGGTTPAAGAFTTLAASAAATLAGATFGTGAANTLAVAGGASGAPFTLTTAGTDADVDARFVLKGRGIVNAPRMQIGSNALGSSLPAPRVFTLSSGLSLEGATTPYVRWGGNFSGNPGASYFMHQFGLDTDTLQRGVLFDYFTSMQSGWAGGRTLHWTRLNVKGPGAGGASFQVSGASFAEGEFEAGGVVGGAAGNLFARNDSARLSLSAGRYWNSLVGNETNIGVYAGTRALWAVGFQAVLWLNSAVRGLQEDAAFKVGMQAGGTAGGWRHAMLFGGRGGWWPHTVTSTLFASQELFITGGPAVAAGYGIDFRNIAWAVAPYGSPGFQVGPTGAVGAASAGAALVKTRDGVAAYTGAVASIDIIDPGYFDHQSGALVLTLDPPPGGAGTTATATVATYQLTEVRSIVVPGTGFAVGDQVELGGGSFSVPCVIQIDKVLTGGVQGAVVVTPGVYTAPSGAGASTTVLTGGGSGLEVTMFSAPLSITTTPGTGYAPNLPPHVDFGSTMRRRPLLRVNMTETPATLPLNPGAATEVDELRVAATKVVGSRRTGWGAPTGTATRTAFATATVTTEQLAERVKALIDDLTTHGLVGA